jgi:hypothetical protein
MKFSRIAYYRFNLLFAALTFPGLLATGLVNIAIDPYGIVNSPVLAGVNELKPEQFNHVRLFKAADTIRIKPRTVALGSSRTDIGLDPKHPALVNKPAYNLGLVGPNMYEVSRYFEHAVANQPNLKTVVLGIDFLMFNENWENSPDFDESRLEKTSLKAQDFLNISFSTSALKASKKTIKSSVESEAYYLYRPDGLRYVYGNEPDEPLEKKFEKMLGGFLEGEKSYQQHQLSQVHLDSFRKVVEICREKNIELKVFISPPHATQIEAIRAAGAWSEFEDWKQEIVAITPVWDFSGYNSITTEPIGEEMENYWDSSHYRKEVGDLILDRLFKREDAVVPEDFGTLVTPDNIESHLKEIRADREAWAKQNPDAVQFVETIAN